MMRYFHKQLSLLFVLYSVVLFGCTDREDFLRTFYEENKSSLDSIVISFKDQNYLASVQCWERDCSTLVLTKSFDEPFSNLRKNNLHFVVQSENGVLSANSISEKKDISLREFCNAFSIPLEVIQYYYDYLRIHKIKVLSKVKESERILVYLNDYSILVYSNDEWKVPHDGILKRLDKKWYMVIGEAY
jgi:hypothetical protein